MQGKERRGETVVSFPSKEVVPSAASDDTSFGNFSLAEADTSRRRVQPYTADSPFELTPAR